MVQWLSEQVIQHVNMAISGSITDCNIFSLIRHKQDTQNRKLSRIQHVNIQHLSGSGVVGWGSGSGSGRGEAGYCVGMGGGGGGGGF